MRSRTVNYTGGGGVRRKGDDMVMDGRSGFSSEESIVCVERSGASTSTPRAIVVEDHVMVAEAFCSLLERSGACKVVASVCDAESALRVLTQHAPELMLIDLGLPTIGGIELTRRVIECAPATKVLIVSGAVSSENIVRALQAGALGVVSKSLGSKGLLEAFEQVRRGRRVIPESHREEVLQRILDSEGTGGELTPLTARELEVLTRLARGESNREIAACLSISVRTVDTHRRNLLSKLEARNNSDLTRIAIRNQLVSC